MRIGPRVALVTAAVGVGVLTVAAAGLLRARRDELEQDMRTAATSVAEALAAGLEPLPADARPLLAARVDRATSVGADFQLEILQVGREKTEDPGWLQLVEAATLKDAPVGTFFNPPDRAAFLAMAFPLHDAPPSEPSRRIVAVMGMKRPATFLDEALLASARRIAPVVVGGTALFVLVMIGLVRRTLVGPLRRLTEAVDAVAKGDLSRALLPEREDEIGQLSSRFNAMTMSLREAREQEARATAARSALEGRLRHSEKLATMGQMAAEIAHEVGTPLNVIGGRARSLAKRASDPAEVLKNADIIATQVERITKIIRQVLDFSRKSHPTLGQVDLPRVVREALEFLAESFERNRVVAEVRIADDVPPIPGVADELQQVCLNLLTNALQAMPDGGTLTVIVDEVVRRKEGLALTAPGRFVLLELGDTGRGIPPADRDRVFEPFFTTKDTGVGTGLGLAVAKGIVKDHDGWIEVDGRPEGGAVFRVYLPLAPEVSMRNA